jgi:hypothetical protein
MSITENYLILLIYKQTKIIKNVLLILSAKKR